MIYLQLVNVNPSTLLPLHIFGVLHVVTSCHKTNHYNLAKATTLTYGMHMQQIFMEVWWANP
jgi:hypothetical protein